MNLTLERIDALIQDLVQLRASMTGPDQVQFIMISYVSAITGVHAELILSTQRNKRTTEARCMLIYLMFENGYGKSAIARRLHINHASVIHAIRKFKRFYEADIDFREMVNQLKTAWKTHSNTLSLPQSSQATL